MSPAACEGVWPCANSSLDLVKRSVNRGRQGAIAGRLLQLAQMTYYARVVFETNASVAERYDDVNAARGWIEAEKNASPESFRLGQIFEGSQVRQIVATCDSEGWHPP